MAIIASAAFILGCDKGASILLLVLEVCVLGVLACRWMSRSTRGEQLVLENDVGPDWESCGVTTPYQRLLAYEFKAEFGELRYNSANRIIAGDWVRKRMADNKDMRIVDRVRLAPLAIELCLLPIHSSVEASMLADDAAVRRRRADVNCPK